MLNIGPQELLVLLIVALLVVGPQRLPEFSRQIGRGLRELRKLQDDVKGMVNLDEVKSMVNLDEVKNMVNLNADMPAATDTRARASGAPVAAPGVHRAPRPAPTPESAGNPTVPTQADTPQDG